MNPVLSYGLKIVVTRASAETLIKIYFINPLPLLYGYDRLTSISFDDRCLERESLTESLVFL